MSGLVDLKLIWIILSIFYPYRCRSETLLLATDGGIKIFDPVTSTSSTLHQHPASSVDFRYNKRDLYFISSSQILYSYYSEYTGSHAEPVPIITAGESLATLAADWRHYKLYYTGRSGRVYRAALQGTTVAPLALDSAVTDLALDVYERRIFYTKRDSTSNSSSLCMSFVHLWKDVSQHFVFNFNTDSYRFSSVAKVAVDHHNKQVYVMGYDDEHLQWHLVQTNYNNTYSTLVFNGPELAQPFALGVFDGQVLWGSLAHDVYTVYSCRLSPACDIDHLEVIYKSSEAVHDVKFYNPLVQTPDAVTACEELACSHNCSVASPYVVACTCPSGLAPGPDGNVCVEDADQRVSSVWLREALRLLSALTDALLTWLTQQASCITQLILLACAAMLLLLTCGLCVLTCARRPRRSLRLGDAYDLRETRHHAAAAARDSER